MELVFEQLPQNLDDLQILPYAKLDRPEYAAGLFVAAMCRYPEDPEVALQMVDFLKGPEPLTPYDRQFLRDRMRGADYLPRSFFQGARPDNNYTPDLPYRLSVTENPYSYQNEGWAQLYIQSGGADSPRPIEMRLKASTGQWFLVKQLLLSGIRIPVALDPWA